MRGAAALAGLIALALTGPVQGCGSNPDALGTSRTMAVDPADYARIGSMQYSRTLPLADREVVLSFDDGPLPPYTARILDVLSAECVKATFFLVGRMAQGFPELVRRIHQDGHTIGSHTQNHPALFSDLPAAKARLEIEEGIASTAAALGDPAALAPFFRLPGLRRSPENEEIVFGHGMMLWSADIPSDDWRGIDAKEVIARTLGRLERKGRGVILFHDIQPVTVMALPVLLRALKDRGYRVVHVVPARGDGAKPMMAARTAASPQGAVRPWPRVPAGVVDMAASARKAASAARAAILTSGQAQAMPVQAPIRLPEAVGPRWTRLQDDSTPRVPEARFDSVGVP